MNLNLLIYLIINLYIINFKMLIYLNKFTSSSLYELIYKCNYNVSLIILIYIYNLKVTINLI